MNYNIQKDMRYIELLSHTFPTIAEASTEIINLQAIQNISLPTYMENMRLFNMYLKMLQEISSVRLMSFSEMN